jgi:uncharacterized protein (TIGR04551 family)
MKAVIVQSGSWKKEQGLSGKCSRWLLLSLVTFVSLWLGGAPEAQAQKGNVPHTPILSVKGYFRFRGDFFKNFSLGVALRNPQKTSSSDRRKGLGGFPYVNPLLLNDVNQSLLPSNSDAPDTLGGGNMRFRLQLNINVTEHVQIFTTLDFLDNIALGSTPVSSLGGNFMGPVDGLSRLQLPPRYGSNSFFDALRVRHVYASVKTPFGFLEMGRMPNHWGLGMLYNSGMGFNSEYGDVVDRLRLVLNIFNHTFTPSLDIASSGPSNARFLHGFSQSSTQSTSTNFLNSVGQGIGMEMADDSLQFQITIQRQDRGQKLRDKQENGELIVNYGLLFAYRYQTFTTECPRNFADCANGNPLTASSPSQTRLFRRDLSLYIPNIWFRLMKGDDLRLELEVAVMVGNMGAGPVYDVNKKAQIPVNILQYGAALEFEYKFRPNGQVLSLGLDLGLASGGEHFVSRYGIQTGAFSQIDGQGQANWNTFVFNPDYQKDLILWRELYGAVNNAFYAKAHLTYNISGENPWEEEGLAIRISGMYSMALNQNATLGLASPLGVELNGTIYYADRTGYILSFSYGVLFPLDGLDYADFEDTTAKTGRKVVTSAGIAHRFWFRAGIRF